MTTDTTTSTSTSPTATAPAAAIGETLPAPLDARDPLQLFDRQVAAALTLTAGARVTLEVSSNFVDLDDLACLRCGAPFPERRLSNRYTIVRDTHGGFLDCPACQTRYDARGGRFMPHGEFNQTRWCAQCQEWRPSGLEGCVGEIYVCRECESEFDGKGPMPAEYAALQAVKARLAKDNRRVDDRGA